MACWCAGPQQPKPSTPPPQSTDHEHWKRHVQQSNPRAGYAQGSHPTSTGSSLEGPSFSNQPQPTGARPRDNSNNSSEDTNSTQQRAQASVLGSEGGLSPKATQSASNIDGSSMPDNHAGSHSRHQASVKPSESLGSRSPGRSNDNTAAEEASGSDMRGRFTSIETHPAEANQDATDLDAILHEELIPISGNAAMDLQQKHSSPSPPASQARMGSQPETRQPYGEGSQARGDGPRRGGNGTGAAEVSQRQANHPAAASAAEAHRPNATHGAFASAAAPSAGEGSLPCCHFQAFVAALILYPWVLMHPKIL